MKKCPFCAEEIQDEAIKCRYCGSFLSMAPQASAPDEHGSPAAPPFAREVDTEGSDAARPGRTRRVLYAGYPSWRAYLKAYTIVILAMIAVPALAYWLGVHFEAKTSTRVLLAVVPVAVGMVAFMTVSFYRRSRIIRVSTTNIESEYGILSKKIEVLELWRCRDVRYRQSLLDRMLGIAHIEIFTADVTTPQLQIVGLPASRELFENIRDSVEIQRQSRNVYGVIQ